MPSFVNYFTNSSIFNGIILYVNTFQVYLSDTVEILREPDQLTAGALDFDEFQWKLLKAFTGILLLNLLLLFASWKYYGKDIYERFIKLSSTKEIEELKASVSKLKLPREHTPRI